jgi:hypothetical protein
MVQLEVQNGNLVLHVQGADKLWAFKSRLEIVAAHISGVRVDSSIAHGWWKGMRVPGINVPGVITAGTFYQHGKRIFWDVHNADNTIVISLHDDRYDELIVEVADPNAAIELIKSLIPTQKGSSASV